MVIDYKMDLEQSKKNIKKSFKKIIMFFMNLYLKFMMNVDEFIYNRRLNHARSFNNKYNPRVIYAGSRYHDPEGASYFKEITNEFNYFLLTTKVNNYAQLKTWLIDLNLPNDIVKYIKVTEDSVDVIHLNIKNMFDDHMSLTIE